MTEFMASYHVNVPINFSFLNHSLKYCVYMYSTYEMSLREKFTSIDLDRT